MRKKIRYNKEKEVLEMKRGLKLLFVFATLFVLVGCGITFTDEELKFKEEYESLNGQKTESGQTYKPIFIEEKTGVQYKDASEIIDIIKKGTGVIYLGFPECPWCRTVLPVLLDAMDEEEYRTLYYFDAREIRDTKHLENGTVVTDKEGTKEYYEMIELLKNYLGPYEGLEDSSIKRIYFPTIIFVKDGKIKGVHIGTIESQEDPYKALTEQEEDILEDTLESYIRQVNGSICGKNGC